MHSKAYLNNPTKQAAIGVIHDAGGHLVLCRADKRPIWSGWQLQRPSLDISIHHDGPLGIIPYSIGTSALDLDRGDWRKLPRSWVNYPTRRKHGRHLYYADDHPRRNQQWDSSECGGEVRGASGYAILWRDGLERIAAAISGPRQLSLFPFPADILEAKAAPGRVIQFPERPLNPYRSLDLERVPGGPGVRGARHDSLFDVVRLRAYGAIGAYRIERGADLAGWLKLVYGFTDDNNRRFRVPLPASSVRSTSYSVGTWVWSRYFDHSPEKQAARAKEGMRQRRDANRGRDQAIVQAVASGRSLRDVGREYGLSGRAIHWILRRLVT